MSYRCYAWTQAVHRAAKEISDSGSQINGLSPKSTAKEISEFTCRKCAYTFRTRFADKCLSCEHVYLTRKP